MVYEWDEDRARRAQATKFAMAMAWIIAVVGVPAAIVLTTSSF
jgi:hypothetical protein